MNKAIILAGGLGSRLRSEVSELPKSMAPIDGRPFLEYQLDGLMSQGIEEVILSVGYKSNHIIDHFGSRYGSLIISYSTEDKPLGTGGAVKKALENIEDNYIFILNGDSIFQVDLKDMEQEHLKQGADCTLAIKELENFDRYGQVITALDGTIIQFKEKEPCEKGMISGGIYCLSVDSFKPLSFPEKFSIEKDFFEKYVDQLRFHSYESVGQFLDIGVPVDFKKAQTLIPAWARK